MARKRRGLPPLPRTLLGSDIGTARSQISTLCSKVCWATVPWTWTLDDILDQLFEPQALSVLRAAAKYARDGGGNESYALTETVGARLTLPDTIMVPNSEKQHAVLDPQMLEALREMSAINAKFNEVLHVLDWCNDHLTPGAARYYWPTIMSLADVERFNAEVPSRFNQPEGIAQIVPHMRNTASTVASALMLGDNVKPESSNKVMLTFRFPGGQLFAGEKKDADARFLWVA